MTAEERLRDLMDTYRLEAQRGPLPSPTFLETASEIDELWSPARQRRYPAARRRTPLLLATAAAVLLIGAVAVLLVDRPNARALRAASRPSAGATVELYVTAIRATYEQMFRASETYWYTPPMAMCRQAALQWTDPARHACHEQLLVAGDDTQLLVTLLSWVHPPAEARTSHGLLLAATQRLRAAFSAQLSADAQNDRQAFLDGSAPIAASLGALCAPIGQLNHQVSSPLPLDKPAWCGQ